MTTISEEQILQRWDTLPDDLREALTEPATTDLIEQACADQKIPEEKTSIILNTVSDVLMGFVRVDDAPAAYVAEAGIDARAAAYVQSVVNAKIFSPLKSSIDALHQPAGQMKVPAPSMGFPTSAAAPMPSTPKILPVDFSSKGWSKARTDAPVITTDIVTPSASSAPMPSILAPKPSSQPAPLSERKPVPSGTVFGEFERLGINSKNSADGSAASSEPAPVILHQDIPMNLQKSADFHLVKPGGGAQMEFDQSKIQSKVMPTMLEFGKSPSSFSSGSTLGSKASQAIPKAVHYSEFQASLASVPNADSGARQRTEITEAQPAFAPTPAAIPVPKPPSPPQPPQSSQPLQPATPVITKVITKDFLEPGK